MSYILDALRRSEQERLRDQPLSTLGHAPIVAAPDGRPRWLLPLLAGNLLVLTVLGVWWLRSLATAANDAALQAPHPSMAASPAAAVAAPPEGDTTILATEANTIDATPTADDRRTEIGLSNEAYENVGEWDPNAATTSHWRLSTHVYSSDRNARAVVIDGVRLKDGERHPSGLRVVEITPTGARVEIDGTERDLDIGE